jgi:hypothetical protein
VSSMIGFLHELSSDRPIHNYRGCHHFGSRNLPRQKEEVNPTDNWVLGATNQVGARRVVCGIRARLLVLASLFDVLIVPNGANRVPFCVLEEE